MIQVMSRSKIKLQYEFNWILNNFFKSIEEASSSDTGASFFNLLFYF